MRPNNQIKRSRGRNGGGRKHTNPMSRNYESNGPNVKIRGNASHIAEKYMQLARDAQTVGDSVTAENMLQHAEHYFRVISAAQAQNPQRSEQPTVTAEDNARGGETTNSDTHDERRAMSENNSDRNRIAPAADDAADGDDQAASSEGEVKRDRPQRERRPRRKPRVAAESGETPASAPKRDADALPAFLTGGQTDAAE
jgi:hypothetical protein